MLLPDSLLCFGGRQSGFHIGQQIRQKLANLFSSLCYVLSLLDILRNGGRPLAKP